MAASNGSTAIRDKILASLARYRALRIGKFPCAFWRLSSRPGLTAIEHAKQSAQAGGDVARKWLTQQLLNTTIRLEFDQEKQDKYKRYLAHVFTRQEVHINRELVRSGSPYFCESSFWASKPKFAAKA
ncbi:hypothetical protein BMR09_01940 [Methylococcaceae bacterium CS3]|nr:hypothetical protein BMR09_01940 [Methylococcaceae bacterium CS3]